MSSNSVNRVAVIGSHSPRRCGIATFTADLADALVQDQLQVSVMAVDDCAEGYDYPPVVADHFYQHGQGSYFDLARQLNASHPDVVCVQHEYGIYGGAAGSYVLDLLRDLNAPIVTTLHTVLAHPNSEQRDVLAELVQLSDRVIVMTRKAQSLLESQFPDSSAKVVVVPHGIPVVGPPGERTPDPDGKRILLTFGLLSPDKGIENMIRAMPEIVRVHPNVEYVIAGVTHPHIRRDHGERYRESLVTLVDELGVSGNVRFIDSFLSQKDLASLLCSASVYITPYLQKEQITSGTLAYAYGCGAVVVSTPYWHAQELLADGRGILVPFESPERYASEILDLLSDPQRLEAKRAQSYEEGVQTQWPSIGRRYRDVFAEARRERLGMLQKLEQQPKSALLPSRKTSEIDPTHLMRMTDDTGMFQHATYAVPRRDEGYCIDDNARAAIVAVDLSNGGYTDFADLLQVRYVSFLDHAFNRQNGRFRNFLGFDRRWLEEMGSEDSHGRTIWACGYMAGFSQIAGVRSLSARLLADALPVVNQFTSLRAWCFAALGLTASQAPNLERGRAEIANLRELGQKILACYDASASETWDWFETNLTYDNARIPQALMAIGRELGDTRMVQTGLRTLTWLVNVQRDEKGVFLPIGSNGFYTHGGTRARYDQQPLEATATIDACLEAYRLSNDPRWQTEAIRAFQWFRGVNTEGLALIDPESGGCRDGLMQGRVNDNQGAESTLAYLSSQIAMQAASLYSADAARAFFW